MAIKDYNNKPAISNTSKLSCRSWSLNAGETCPASRDFKTGELVPACKGCYATTGNYRFPNVKAPRDHNRKNWKRDNWVQMMVAELDTDRYFRWFDSGDVYHPELAKKILEVMKLTPWCKHWLPTRMNKVERVAPILERMKKLDNVMVRYSSDEIDGTFDKHHGSTIIAEENLNTLDKKVKLCSAPQNEGKCGTCRDCWNKDIGVIGYVAHGRSMKANLKRLGLVDINARLAA